MVRGSCLGTQILVSLDPRTVLMLSCLVLASGCCHWAVTDDCSMGTVRDTCPSIGLGDARRCCGMAFDPDRAHPDKAYCLANWPGADRLASRTPLLAVPTRSVFEPKPAVPVWAGHTEEASEGVETSQELHSQAGDISLGGGPVPRVPRWRLAVGDCFRGVGADPGANPDYSCNHTSPMRKRGNGNGLPSLAFRAGVAHTALNKPLHE
jgi:hypothetical protein